jgi:hypothetical protein
MLDSLVAGAARALQSSQTPAFSRGVTRQGLDTLPQ